MRFRSVALIVATITLLSVASGDATESRLRIVVSPRVSTAPAAVRVRAFVTPESTNRALEISADSDSFYRRSLVPLDGANAAPMTEMLFKNLPGGEYEVSVALVGADGRRIVDKREVTVTSSFLD